MAFTTAGGTTPVPGPTAWQSVRARRIRLPGTRLPLPDMQGVLAQFANAADSCPRGLKYVNNPWQDRVIDAFRQRDTRWGYNGKPTKNAAADNNGVPVTAAGDEAAYHYGGRSRPGIARRAPRRLAWRSLWRRADDHLARVHGRRTRLLDRRWALLNS